jgi:hypothetical protein
MSSTNHNRRGQTQRAHIPPQFKISKSQDYKSIFATGVFGGLNPNDGQIIFFLDRLMPQMIREQPGRQRLEYINRELQVEIHLSPSQFKNIARWMNQHIQIYEQNFGEIPIRTKEIEKEDIPSGLIS